MKVDKNIIVEVNKKHIIILTVMVCLFLLVSFLLDDQRYWNSLFKFDADDEYTIRAIEAWDHYGCSYFYKEDQEKALENYESIIGDEKMLEYVKKSTAIYGFINLYSDQEIEDAFNAIVYGCNNSEHDSGKYKSVADIPERLFRNCYLQMLFPNQMDKSIKEVYEIYLSDLKKL
ncbi:hypothetical protein [Butyrivibrio fibrisolvens]|uniref:hypothetical protein n=2 Tax=Butyrivibrio fibrisolvens TaxID=831 RepID=UPI0003B65CC3|nr:hypothetical protein [Butyrivibrio fibrisolvens]